MHGLAGIFFCRCAEQKSVFYYDCGAKSIVCQRMAEEARPGHVRVAWWLATSIIIMGGMW
jgi:hypothetical protein